jgi:hypothetical protein
VTITSAFVLSIFAIESCDLVEGEAFHYHIPAEGLDPLRDLPDMLQRIDFTLGVYKANAPPLAYYCYGGQCIHYGNGVSDSYMNAGAAEASARFFGSFEAALGGLSMLAFFGLAATERKTSFYIAIFTGILCAAALFQVLIFVLLASDHCSDSYWNEFLSASEQNEEITSAVHCEMGDGGWYAVVALILYILAALLVTLKWSTPSCSICNKEWNKDFSSGDPINRRFISDEEEQLQGAPTMNSTQPKAAPEEAPTLLDVDKSPIHGDQPSRRHHKHKVAI